MRKHAAIKNVLRGMASILGYSVMKNGRGSSSKKVNLRARGRNTMSYFGNAGRYVRLSMLHEYDHLSKSNKERIESIMLREHEMVEHEPFDEE